MSKPHDDAAFGPRGGEPVAARRVGSGEMTPRQSETTEPIVEHPHLPRMGEVETRQRLVGGHLRLMDEYSVQGATDEARGEMRSVPNELEVAAPGEGEYPPQQPASTRPPSAEPAGYLRLRLRVDDGEMSLVDVSRVAGPLAPPGPVHGGMAYEVRLGQLQLGAGDVPDPGVRRGFVSPDSPERGHSVVDVPTYEFTARVPADRVSAVNLRDLQVTVYRMDSGQVVHPTPEHPLREHVGHVAEEVATLRGIRIDRLPQELRVRIERALN